MRKGVARPDVLIIGGGPSGSTAAQLLASWGWSVVLMHRPTGRPSLAESLPPSTRKLLSFLGQIGAIDAASFHASTGNVALWAGRSTTTTTEPGFHVSRAAFDRVLRRLAKRAGARLVNAVVERIDLGATPRAFCARPDRIKEVIDPRIVLDCSGRAGVVARRGFRRSDAGYRTLAIAAEWRSRSWSAAERTKTIIESYRDGWAWSVPLSGERRQSTVMVDPERLRNLASAGVSGLQQIYAQELGKARALRERLSAARQSSEVWACDASMYHAPRPAESGVMLVGDAASFIEPLSSAGVKKALTSAWRAAVVTNTCLAKPELAGAAFDLFARREHLVYTDCVTRSARFFAEADAAHDDPFWSARAAGSQNDAAVAANAFTDEELGRDRRVRGAFERLRASECCCLRPAPSLRFLPIADIEGREVVMREAVVLPGIDLPLRFAAGVNLPALARLARDCHEVPRLISAYRAQVGPAQLGELLTGLSLLVARRALIHEDSRP